MTRADEVVAHFDELDSTRTRMHTAQQQVRALAPVRGLRSSHGGGRRSDAPR
jgi:uncharacterized protein YPO0396